MGWSKQDFVGTSKSAKIAARMRHASEAYDLDEMFHAPYSQLLPVAIAFCLAAAVGAFLDGPVPVLNGLGIGLVDPILLGQQPAGGGTIGSVMYIMVRGLALFVMAGVPLFIARLILNVAAPRVTPLVACWMGILFVPLVYLLFKG